MAPVGLEHHHGAQLRVAVVHAVSRVDREAEQPTTGAADLAYRPEVRVDAVKLAGLASRVHGTVTSHRDAFRMVESFGDRVDHC